jgi:hypothetical protein
MILLKIALIAALAAVLVVLVRYLLRDKRDGVVHSHLGTFQKDQEPGAYWFWTINYGILAVFVAISIVVATVALIN